MYRGKESRGDGSRIVVKKKHSVNLRKGHPLRKHLPVLPLV